VTASDKPVVWLSGEVKEPPFSKVGRVEAGLLLRQLQQGKTLGMPHARAMPGIGPRCLELRIPDERQTWRIVVRTDPDAVVIAEVFSKKTRDTPKRVIEACRRRLRRYDETAKE
jgi:phage-related protein